MHVTNFICNNLSDVTNKISAVKESVTTGYTSLFGNEIDCEAASEIETVDVIERSKRDTRNISNLRINIPNRGDTLKHTIQEQLTLNIDGSEIQIPQHSYFKHLDFVGQGYWEHMRGAMGYSWKSAKCCFYFFIHALWPDWFQTHGSEIINDLSDHFVERYQQRILELRRGQI